jgi:hypothetical protein
MRSAIAAMPKGEQAALSAGTPVSWTVRSCAEGEFTGYAIDGVNRQLRWFCGDCGTTLYWKVAAFLPEHTGVAGGAFADTPLAEPMASVSNEGQRTWLHLPGVPTNVALGTR